MALWGTGQSGCNPISALNFTDLRLGDDLTLLDGTEAAATGLSSIAFARGAAPGSDAGSTFSITGCAAGSKVTIQGSNGVAAGVTPTLANMDASFQELPGGAFIGNGVFTDPSRMAFYRAKIVLLVGPDAPVVIVKR